MNGEPLTDSVTLHCGDSRDVLRGFADASIDAVVTDPPYALVSITKRFGGENAAPAKGNEAYARASAGFMGKQWDTGETAFAEEFWREVMRVLKPGGHVLAFSATRTYHRLAVAIEDAGFEIRDMTAWLYGSGFPKSHDVSKGIDRAAGAEREVTREARVVDDFRPDHIDMDPRSSKDRERRDEPATPEAAAWQGWGTALKPALEPIVVARKPLCGTVAANVLAHGTGALNIDACRIEANAADVTAAAVPERSNLRMFVGDGEGRAETRFDMSKGRWPANVIHDGSDEVVAGFPDTGAAKSGGRSTGRNFGQEADDAFAKDRERTGRDDTGGSAARFFYSAKADADDRLGSKHPTVKPVDLMQYLVRLVTRKGGTVLDPFAGTGTTGEACIREGMRCILIEREPEYQSDIRKRMRLAMAGPDERKRARTKPEPVDALPLFGGAE